MSYWNVIVQPNAEVVLMQWVLLYIKFSRDEIWHVNVEF